jgi:hypothetical protein
MNDGQTTTRSDARAALASVSATGSAILERRSWPFWLSILVSASFGACAALRTYFGVDRPAVLEILLGLACVVPAFVAWIVCFRIRGLVVRDTFRWSSAIVICGLFVIESHIPEASGGMPLSQVLTALIHGMLNSMTILLVWGTVDGVASLARLIRQRRRVHA